MTNVRLQNFPQMQDYDEMPSGQNVPFAMLSGPISFKSIRINTDRNGFRVSLFGEKLISTENLDELENVNFLIGGSTVFGVGATTDHTTISSYLTQKTKSPWINLGLRGGIGFQEIIHLLRFIRKAKKIDNIIFFSGVNDAYANFLYDSESSFDRYFNEMDLEFKTKSIKRQLLCYFFAKIYKNRPEDYKDLNFSEMIANKVNKNEIPEKTNPVQKNSENIFRNFRIYSGLKGLVSKEVGFTLQPLSFWANKRLTETESSVLNYLNEIQANTGWPAVKSKLSNRNFYEELITDYENASKSEGIKFYNSNEVFNGNETLFVDSVHLTDLGNEKAANYLIEKFNLRNT